jgi:hypothetical protein
MALHKPKFLDASHAQNVCSVQVFHSTACERLKWLSQSAQKARLESRTDNRQSLSHKTSHADDQDLMADAGFLAFLARVIGSSTRRSHRFDPPITSGAAAHGWDTSFAPSLCTKRRTIIRMLAFHRISALCGGRLNSLRSTLVTEAERSSPNESLHQRKTIICISRQNCWPWTARLRQEFCLESAWQSEEIEKVGPFPRKLN